MDKATKARYVTAAHQLRAAYEQRMKGYRNKNAALIKSQRKMKLFRRRRSKAKKHRKRRAMKSLKGSKKVKAIGRRKGNQVKKALAKISKKGRKVSRRRRAAKSKALKKKSRKSNGMTAKKFLKTANLNTE